MPVEHNFVQIDKYKHLTDEELVRKILEGSVSLFEVIMRRYNQRLFRIQRSYIADENAIKDTLQITYLKAFEHLETFRGESHFSTWITRIAINEALKYIKREKRYSKIHVVDEEGKQHNRSINDQKDTPENQIILDELKVLLETSVHRLPRKYRSVYMMREVEQMSTRETADCLQISESNVKARLYRARKRVREDLERRVADTEIFNFLGTQCDEIVYRVMDMI